ncbi:MAG: serpin family protein, partial [Actinobacteria bacterium]|nr:serpin family protein [Actinomycetota bacterium]
RVRLALPRFRQQAGYDLVPVLRGLGVTDAFGGQADFGAITEAERLRLGVVAHSAFIDVDEQGTEAAAATAAVAFAAAMTGGEVVVLTVDRPFLFAITDTGTGLPLFLGRVTEPPPE